MTQTAYSVENLRRLFPPSKPPSPKARRSSLLQHSRSSDQPLLLDALINNPPGVDRSADTIRFAGQAARAGWTREAVKAVLLDPDKAISGHCLDQDDPGRAADRAISKAFSDADLDEPVVLAPSPYVWVSAEDIPPLDWLLGHWLLREEVTFLVAPGGVGKTTFLTAAALSLATGKNLLGKPVVSGPQRVWLWNLEDSIPMMTRTIQATAKLHGIKPGELSDRLYLDTSRDGTPLCTASRVNGTLTLREPMHVALVAALRERKIDVLIVDPFVSSHEGNENDNGEMDRIIKAWCRVAQEASCAVVLCHHTSKAGSAEVNTMSARGAVAMTAAARVVLVLNSMSVMEANRLAIDEEERRRLVQVSMDKSNRAPLERANWFRKASVPLGPGDSAAAVEPYTPPAADELLTAEALASIRAVIGNRLLRESPQSPDWAGYEVASALGMRRPDPSTRERAQVTQMLAALLSSGALVKDSGKDLRSKTVPVLRLAGASSPLAQLKVETGGEVEKSGA